MQSGLCLLLALFLLSQHYENTVKDYGKEEAGAFNLYIDQVADDKLEPLSDFLLSSKAFLIKKEIQQKHQVTNIKISVGGNFNQAIGLSFGHLNLFEKTDLQQLANQPTDKIIGRGQGTLSSLKSIPRPLFASNIFVSQIPVDDAKAILGNYTVVGLNGKQQAYFIKQIAKITGQSEARLRQQRSGAHIDSSSIGLTLSIGLGVTFIVLVILLTIYLISRFKEIGILTLNGWAKYDILKVTFGGYIEFGVVIVPINILLGIFISGLQFNGIWTYLISGIMSVILVLLAILLVSTMLCFVSDLKLIKGFLPKKMLYGLGFSVYGLLAVGLVITSTGLEGPVRQIKENTRLLTAWQPVLDYQTLKKFEEGQNPGTLAGTTHAFSEEIYKWYQAMEGATGVYLATGEYYSKKQLQELKRMDAYETTVPAEPFTLASFSPNYLKDHGIYNNQAVINRAKAGKRIYLIPESISNKQLKAIKNWLIENDTADLEQVKNTFARQRQFEFIKYPERQPIFTWTNHADQSVLTKSPIMLIETSQNMSVNDYVNLHVNTLEGPLKFKNERILKMYTRGKVLKQYQLADNKMKFVPVQQYINGLRNDLRFTIYLFMGVIGFVLLILALTLIALMLIYSVANEKIIFVKRLMGYSNLKIYAWLVSLVCGVTGLQVISVLYLHLDIGLKLCLVSFVLQMLLMVGFIKVKGIEKLKGK